MPIFFRNLMPIFFRKPGAVRAIQWYDGRQHPEVYEEDLDDTRLYHLVTDKGRIQISPGDWLVEANGRIWVVEKDVFDQLYEPVEVQKQPEQEPSATFVTHDQWQHMLSFVTRLGLQVNELEQAQKAAPAQVSPDRTQQLVILVGLLSQITAVEYRIATHIGHLDHTQFGGVGTRSRRLELLNAAWNDVGNQIQALWITSSEKSNDAA